MSAARPKADIARAGLDVRDGPKADTARWGVHVGLGQNLTFRSAALRSTDSSPLDKLGQRREWRHLTFAREEPSLLSLVVPVVTRMSLAKAVTSRRLKPRPPSPPDSGWGFLFLADPTGGHQTWAYFI
jgi:hypothetical protein